MKNVSIYTTDTCTYCKMAKELFNEYKVLFTEYNVGSDIARRKEMIEKSGQMGVPVIVIDDEVMVGYDRDTLKEALGVS